MKKTINLYKVVLDLGKTKKVVHTYNEMQAHAWAQIESIPVYTNGATVYCNNQLVATYKYGDRV